MCLARQRIIPCSFTGADVLDFDEYFDDGVNTHAVEKALHDAFDYFR